MRAVRLALGGLCFLGCRLGPLWHHQRAQLGVGGQHAVEADQDLPMGTEVSGASTFTNVTSTLQNTAFQNAGNHILGFRFVNEATRTVNYGYLTMSNGGATGFPAMITGYSYENEGNAIAVVPEPSTGILLSMGARALGALKLRRQRSRAAT